jgi:cobalt-zinc-cadmium efflux system outer membrane protein
MERTKSISIHSPIQWYTALQGCKQIVLGTKTRLIHAFFLCLVAVNLIGCKSVDCGWHSYRFAKTRADVTQPNIPESKEHAVTTSEYEPLPNAEGSQTFSANEAKPKSKMNLVSHSKNLETNSEDSEFKNNNSNSQCIPASHAIAIHTPVSRSPSDQPTVAYANNPDPAVADSTSAGSSQSESNSSRFFDLPRDFPGGDATPLKLPRMDSSATATERLSIVNSLFADLPGAKVNAIPFDVEGRIMTLTEMQDIALENNPTLRQAVARVEAARGAMIQAGLYPNPTFGYEGDTIGTADTNGYNGGFLNQQFITAGKLGLAQNAAMMEMRAAEFDLRTTRIEVATNVRRLYFSILVEQERIRLYESIQSISDEAYQAQRTLVAGGESALYEPLQLRVLSVLARNNVLTAKNSLAAFWRQIAAAVGTPELLPATVAGSIDMIVPQIELQQAIDMMLAQNADLTAAQYRISSNQYKLRLQQATPIPDVTVYSALQRDSTSPLTPNRTTFNLQVSVPVPVFNRNQGNITSARATLVDADRNYFTVKNQLQADLADAYNRYITSQAIVTNYREAILPDQVRVYRATYSRFRIAGQEVDFAQVVVTQQTLVHAVIGYLDAVTGQWQATVDVARLLQVDDLFTMDLLQP